VAEARAPLAHQFDDLEQQREAATLGMWVFLATEIMFFGGLFTLYAAYRSVYAQAFAEGSRHLDVVLGAANTAVLISSSLTMALAVHGAQVGRRRMLLGGLAATVLLGTTFLGIKAVEYVHKFEDGLVPGLAFTFTGPDAPHVELFFWMYFAMTGVHALHLVIGIGALAALLIQGGRGRFTPQYHVPVELTGLYWHFVDIIWIFLLPLLYLIGRH